jgi:hypothetical protein
MISLLFLPVEGSYDKYLEFLMEKMVVLFEIETDTSILKGVVDIFFNLKGYNVAALTDHMLRPNRISQEVIILKKISILCKFFYSDYINRDFAE